MLKLLHVQAFSQLRVKLSRGEIEPADWGICERGTNRRNIPLLSIIAITVTPMQAVALYGNKFAPNMQLAWL